MTAKLSKLLHHFADSVGDISNKDFSHQYRKDLKKIASKYKNRRHDIAVSRIEHFVAIMHKLLVDKEMEFDAILAPGNSGLFMLEIAKIVYDELGIELPKAFALPVYRESGDLPDKIEVSGSEILIVDDEIMTGTSAKKIIRLLNGSVSHYNVTIVAESHHFQWHHRVPGVSVYFYPFATSIPGMTNNISYLLNEKDYRAIIKILPVRSERKQIIALILSGKLKDKNNDGKWYFDETQEVVVSSRLKNYREIKRNLHGEITTHVKSGIQKYKDGKIKFVVD